MSPSTDVSRQRRDPATATSRALDRVERRTAIQWKRHSPTILRLDLKCYGGQTEG